MSWSSTLRKVMKNGEKECFGKEGHEISILFTIHRVFESIMWEMMNITLVIA